MYNIRRRVTLLLLIMCASYNFDYTLAIAGDSNNIRSIYRNEYRPAVCIAHYRPGYSWYDSVMCSGVLITSTHVLSAEHCLSRIRYPVVEILIGSGQLPESTPYYSIWWLSFSQWSLNENIPITNSIHDMIIIKIFGLPIRFAPGRISRITPVSNLYGLTARVFGCGYLDNYELPASITTAGVRVLSKTDCERIVETIIDTPTSVPDHVICTNNNPVVQTQSGDSGGALVYAGEIIGMNIGIGPQLGTAHPRQVNLHVYLHHFRNYINHVTQLS